MASFQQRKATGDAHERYVAEQLIERGWTVDFWGQGLLSRALQRALRGTDSSIRWFPDLIAAKAGDLVLIDRKGGVDQPAALQGLCAGLAGAVRPGIRRGTACPPIRGLPAVAR